MAIVASSSSRWRTLSRSSSDMRSTPAASPASRQPRPRRLRGMPVERPRADRGGHPARSAATPMASPPIQRASSSAGAQLLRRSSSARALRQARLPHGSPSDVVPPPRAPPRQPSPRALRAPGSLSAHGARGSVRRGSDGRMDAVAFASSAATASRAIALRRSAHGRRRLGGGDHPRVASGGRRVRRRERGGVQLLEDGVDVRRAHALQLADLVTTTRRRLHGERRPCRLLVQGHTARSAKVNVGGGRACPAAAVGAPPRSILPARG